MDCRISRPHRVSMSAFVLVIIAALSLFLDFPVARFLANGRLRGWMWGDAYGFIRLSETFSHGLTVLVLIGVAVRLDRRGWSIAPLLGLSSLGAGLIANLIKLFFARGRPSSLELTGNVYQSFGAVLPGDIGHDMQSFPSAHTAVAAGFAYALSRLYPRAASLFWLVAGVSAFQRVETGAHFLSDVVIGAAIGLIVASQVCLRQRLMPTEISAHEFPLSNSRGSNSWSVAA